jgi:hypothetical protein
LVTVTLPGSDVRRQIRGNLGSFGLFAMHLVILRTQSNWRYTKFSSGQTAARTVNFLRAVGMPDIPPTG